MLKRTYLYDFGVSQDDPKSELRSLSLTPGDRLLCIASAGEVPLDILVNSHHSIQIDAVDITETQLFLSNLKFQAAIQLEGKEAAKFLGYFPSTKTARKKNFKQIREALPEKEVLFWMNHSAIYDKGPIHLGKYETYIARFAPLGRWLLGGKSKLQGLFDCGGIEDQKVYFDRELRSGLLKRLFQIMFSNLFYRSRGISEQGLIHMGKQNIGLTFYHKFRDFCTSTPVRNNWLLQFVLFDQVLFEQALPSYLLPTESERLKKESARLHFIKLSYTDILKNHEPGYYNKFALSNVSDWLTVEEFTELLQIIRKKAGSNAQGLIRYIHSADVSDPELPNTLGFNPDLGKELLHQDRFPFYNLIPFGFRNNGEE